MPVLYPKALWLPPVIMSHDHEPVPASVQPRRRNAAGRRVRRDAAAGGAAELRRGGAGQSALRRGQAAAKSKAAGLPHCSCSCQLR